MVRVKLQARIARRMPDPLFNTLGTERHIFFVSIESVPMGIPLGLTPRTLKTRWDVYDEARMSLFDNECTPGIFHLKSRGITVIARDLNKIDDDEYELEIADGEGVVDGARIYQLILEAQQQRHAELPEKQFVQIEVWTKVPAEWLAEITKARNTSIQVASDSLMPLQVALEWLKEELLEEDYFAHIAWTEYERGGTDIRDILCLMTCFNVTSYPNVSGGHPVAAYDNRAVVAASFSEDSKRGGHAYRRMRPILKDILTLYETIRLEFPKYHAQSTAKAPALIESSPGKPFEFPFIRALANERLARGAAYPVLAAFRWMVEEDRSGEALKWRGGFDAVLVRWREAAPRLVVLSVEKARELGGLADALGRNPSHWAALHKEVALLDLLARQHPAGGARAPGAAERKTLE